MARRKKSDSSCLGGCLTLLVCMFILGGVASLFNNNKQVNTSVNETIATENDEKPYYSGYEEILEEVGLNVEDYGIGKTRRYGYFGSSKEFTGNYQNLTVEKINDVFSNENITVKEVFEQVGRPDVIDLYLYENKGERYYTIGVIWSSEDREYELYTYKPRLNSSDIDRVFMSFSLKKSMGNRKEVLGVPADAVYIDEDRRYTQLIMEKGDFKGAQYEYNPYK